MVGIEVEEVMEPKVTRVRTEMMQIVSHMELTAVLVGTVAMEEKDLAELMVVMAVLFK